MGVWTNNWRGVKNAMLMGSSARGMSTIMDENGAYVVLNGSQWTILFPSPIGKYNTTPINSYIGQISSSSPAAYIKVGAGATPPSAADYRMDTYASITQLSVSSGTEAYDTSTGKKTKTITLTVQNQTNSAITLREWAIFLVYSTPSLTTNYYPVLVYRDLFAEPITLASYEAATLELTLEMTLSDPI